ncbi:hypothetical protein ACYSNM_09630 [Myroides sp. LJL116]
MSQDKFLLNISFKQLLWGLCVFIATSIYICQRTGMPLYPWINNYVNDFLTLPIILSISLFIVRKIKRDPLLTLPIYLVLLVASFYSVYFEYYLPKVTFRYTQDPIDVVLYFLGGLAYYFINKRY